MPIQKNPSKAKSKKTASSKPVPSKTVLKKQKTPMPPSISSEKRLEDILAETEAELVSIQPEIEKLEREVDRLKTLKLTKQKLITLKLSIQSILGNYGTRGESTTTDVRDKESPLPKHKLTSSQDLVSVAFSESNQTQAHPSSNKSYPSNNLSFSGEGSEHMFLPDVAFRQVK
ncbi:MAG: hypothetical protein K2X66_03780, partial [Cyanobacteria bacterium]|nr:hypothetical protein [Cyanobacteriota bacterium]